MGSYTAFALICLKICHHLPPGGGKSQLMASTSIYANKSKSIETSTGATEVPIYLRVTHKGDRARPVSRLPRQVVSVE